MMSQPVKSTVLEPISLDQDLRYKSLTMMLQVTPQEDSNGTGDIAPSTTWARAALLPSLLPKNCFSEVFYLAASNKASVLKRTTYPPISFTASPSSQGQTPANTSYGANMKTLPYSVTFHKVALFI
ncbi:hypothetical protein AN958_03728 [Leucoagaricus sp. SymC.cos]|nr:hypothetical protein AN958_03728 [Leucoagaricus sp. SymC.cos]